VRCERLGDEVLRAVFRNDSLSLKDVQSILGHAHLSTTSERVAAKIGSAGRWLEAGSHSMF
jgi:hypothetical protein